MVRIFIYLKKRNFILLFLFRLSLTNLICELHKQGIYLDDEDESDGDEEENNNNKVMIVFFPSFSLTFLLV